MRIEALLLAGSVFLISSCATGFGPDAFCPQSVPVSREPVTTDALGDVTVTAGATHLGQNLSPGSFRLALIEVIRRSNLLGTDAGNAIKVDARIYAASFPATGLSMSSSLGVHYTVTGPDGKVLLNRDVFCEGKATVGEAFIGSARSVKAFQSAIQGHFTLFLDALKDGLVR